MRVVDVGVIEYCAAEKLQLEQLEAVARGEEETLFLLEHPPVVTLGRNADLRHLHVSPEMLAANGAQLARASRGGDITCHFPGQLVAYPIFRLERRPGGLRQFFGDVEEVLLRTLARFGIHAARAEGRPGVWLGKRKIASIGVAVRRWVSYHGLALNVGPELSLFSLITLCGLADASPTSLALELAAQGLPVPETAALMTEVKDVLAQEFLRLFAPAELAAREIARG